MPLSVDHCNHRGCTRPRKLFTAFCDEHHQEYLRRRAAAPVYPTPPGYDPNYVRRSWSKVLKWEKLGVITREEVLGQLYDHFVHSRRMEDGHPQWGTAALEILPDEVAAELLAYVKVHPPNLFAPLSAFPEVHAADLRAAALAQEELMALLEKKPR